MSNKKLYKQTLGLIYTLEPSVGLRDRIDFRIEQARSIQAKRNAVSYGVLTTIAIVALVPVIKYLTIQATSSGLYNYLSLFVSDSSYMFDNWKIATLSITESIPIIGVALTLGTLLISLYSLKKSLAYIRILHLTNLPIRS